MSTLSQVLSGLHETDVKMYDTIGLSAIQKDAGVAIPILNSDQRIDPTYNSLKVETVDVEAVDQLKKIKFIGNCKITSTENGEIILRIGDNLNSSTFNTKDGQTSGIASYSRNPDTDLKSATLSGGTSKTNIWVKGANDSIEITTSGKIHLDDNTTGKFKLYVEAGAGSAEYEFGPITGNGYYANGATVSSTAPTGDAAKAYLSVTNMAEETKTAQGATGYEADVTFIIDVDALATTDGEVKFRVEPVSGMVGAVSYPTGANTYQTVAYYLNDNSTKPTVSGVSGILPAATGSNIQTWSGLTSISGGTVTYKATFANLNNPATSNASNSSIKFDNTKNFSADVTDNAITTYSGEITKTATTWTDGHYTSIGNSLSVSGSNINGTTTATGKFYGSNGAEITEVDVYKGTPDASVRAPIRTALDGTAFTDAANLGSDDLMMYHGSLQHPSKVTVTTSSYGNSSMVKPSDSNDKIALFHFTAIGTENGGNVQLSGASLTSSSVKLVEVGNSIATLRDVTKNTNGGMGDKITTSADNKTITYQYTFPAEGEKVKPDTGCWIRITLASTSNAKIAKITRNA